MADEIRDREDFRREKKKNPVKVGSHPDIETPTEEPHDTPPGDIVDRDRDAATERPGSGKSQEHFKGDQT